MQRLVVRGQPRTLGLGGYPLVSLAQAQDKAFAKRRLARSGDDPLAEKKKSKAIPTFEDAAARTIAVHRPELEGCAARGTMVASIRTYAVPHLKGRRIDEIASADVLAVLTPIWRAKAETARQLRQRLGAVMKWAIANGYRLDNPAGEALGQVLGRQSEGRLHRALPYVEVAEAIRTVGESNASEALKRAFEFLVLTAARSCAARLARWDEIDMAERLWTVPPERMKMGREHRVPLSARALEVLDAARERTGGTGWVFSNPRGGTLSASTLSSLLTKLGIAAVPTDSGRASTAEPRSERMPRAKSSIGRWPTWRRTRRGRLMPAQTFSNASGS